jgi:hypothetical protein
MLFGALKERDHIPLLLNPVMWASRDGGDYHMHQSKRTDGISHKRMPSSTIGQKDEYIQVLQIICIKIAQVHLLTYRRKQTCTSNDEIVVNAREIPAVLLCSF